MRAARRGRRAITGTAAVADRGSLQPLAALGRACSSEGDDMERIHHRDHGVDSPPRWWSCTGETVHRNAPHPVAGELRFGSSCQGFSAFYGHLHDRQQSARARICCCRREVDDHGDVLGTDPNMAPGVLVTPRVVTPIEAGRIGEQPFGGSVAAR